MKAIISSFLLIVSLNGMAASSVSYDCNSFHGLISFTEKTDGSVVVDLTQHSIIHFDNSYYIFSEYVKSPEENYLDFVLKVTPQTFNKKSGNKFENGRTKLSMKSQISRDLQTCKIDLELNKSNLVASLAYSCSTLRRNAGKFEEKLDCMSSQLE